MTLDALHLDADGPGQGTKQRDRAEVAGVAVKALVRIGGFWKLRNVEMADLAGVSVRTFERMKAGRWSGRLSQDQIQRVSALVGIYKGLHLFFGAALADRWVSLPNRGPLFQGRRPVDFMTEGGVPAMLDVRDHVDALRGGM